MKDPRDNTRLDHIKLVLRESPGDLTRTEAWALLESYEELEVKLATSQGNAAEYIRLTDPILSRVEKLDSFFDLATEQIRCLTAQLAKAESLLEFIEMDEAHGGSQAEDFRGYWPSIKAYFEEKRK